MIDNELDINCGIHLTSLGRSLDRDFYECTTCCGEGLVYPSRRLTDDVCRCHDCLGSGIAAIPFGEF